LLNQTLPWIIMAVGVEFLSLQVVLQRKTPFPGRYLEGSDKGAPEPGFFCGHHAWSLESVITVSARIFLTQGPLSSRPRKPLGARGIMKYDERQHRREISASGSYPATATRKPV
jgi:hypothetical protein